MVSACPIIFSGHNERAVVALCRYFSSANIPFKIVASDGADAIFETSWESNVLFQRQDSSLSLNLMERIAFLLEGQNLRPVLCPTSEFLNHFFLNNRQAIESSGWNCVLPDKHIYMELTDKLSSLSLIRQITGLNSPPVQPVGQWVAPCVLKPKYNMMNGKIMYPLLCHHPHDLEVALEQIDTDYWFSQNWIDGQSIYFCAYIDRDGHFDSFWQENLMQQPDGKSIVLARTSTNPGIDEESLMDGLHNKGYFGPFMMEIMRDEENRMHFIEVNPRFWGPLNLALKACPGLLSRFSKDHGLNPDRKISAPNRKQQWYAWSFGARIGNCRKYPGLRCVSEIENIEVLLKKYDVYAEKDTLALSDKR